MDYQPTVAVPSLVLAGVTVTLRKMSPARRSAFYLATAEYREQIRQIRRERRALDKEYIASAKRAEEAVRALAAEYVAAGEDSKAAAAKAQAAITLDMDPERLARWSELTADETALDEMRLKPALLRELFVSIDGFTIAGEAPGVDLLLAEGPEELVREIGEACALVTEMPAGEQKNWQWPGTSSKQEAGPQTSGSAASASSEGSTGS